jgi:hypothetical protein
MFLLINNLLHFNAFTELLLEVELVNPISLIIFYIYYRYVKRNIVALNAMSIFCLPQFMSLVGGGRRSMHIHLNKVEDMGTHSIVAIFIVFGVSYDF